MDAILCAFNNSIAAELKTKLGRGRSNFDGWSDQQLDIFSWTVDGDGNLVIIARAGTGKSTTLLEAVLRIPGVNAQARTLHSLGYGIVKKAWGQDVQLDGKLSWKEKRARTLAVEAMETDQPRQMVTLVARLMTKGREMQPFAEHPDDLIDIAYEFDCDPPDEFYQSGWNIERVCELAIKAMKLAKRETKIIDFADMLYLPVANGWAKPQFDLVCVDEAQDMNVVQLELAQRVCKKDGRIMVIGDDRQAIYGFRGADSGSIERLRRELDATVLPLNTTYRCPKLVVEEANRLVPDYYAAPSAPEGTIDNIMISHLHKHAQAGNFVLSRTNAALSKACLHLLRNNVRAKIQGKDIGAKLANVINKVSGNYDFMPLTQFLAKLDDWREKEIEKAMKKELESRVAVVTDQAETLVVLAEGLDKVKDLKFRIDDLFGEAAAMHGVVVCSTVHKAKGLEAERVFLLRETFYPGLREKYTDARMLEEANIEYVAITRSMSHLTWVSGKL